MKGTLIKQNKSSETMSIHGSSVEKRQLASKNMIESKQRKDTLILALQAQRKCNEVDYRLKKRKQREQKQHNQQGMLRQKKQRQVEQKEKRKTRQHCNWLKQLERERVDQLEREWYLFTFFGANEAAKAAADLINEQGEEKTANAAADLINGECDLEAAQAAANLKDVACPEKLTLKESEVIQAQLLPVMPLIRETTGESISGTTFVETEQQKLPHLNLVNNLKLEVHKYFDPIFDAMIGNFSVEVLGDTGCIHYARNVMSEKLFQKVQRFAPQMILNETNVNNHVKMKAAGSAMISVINTATIRLTVAHQQRSKATLTRKNLDIVVHVVPKLARPLIIANRQLALCDEFVLEQQTGHMTLRTMRDINGNPDRINGKMVDDIRIPLSQSSQREAQYDNTAPPVLHGARGIVTNEILILGPKECLLYQLDMPNLKLNLPVVDEGETPTDGIARAGSYSNPVLMSLEKGLLESKKGQYMITTMNPTVNRNDMLSAIGEEAVLKETVPFTMDTLLTSDSHHVLQLQNLSSEMMIVPKGVVIAHIQRIEDIYQDNEIGCLAMDIGMLMKEEELYHLANINTIQKQDTMVSSQPATRKYPCTAMYKYKQENEHVIVTKRIETPTGPEYSFTYVTPQIREVDGKQYTFKGKTTQNPEHLVFDDSEELERTSDNDDCDTDLASSKRPAPSLSGLSPFPKYSTVNNLLQAESSSDEDCDTKSMLDYADGDVPLVNGEGTCAKEPYPWENNLPFEDVKAFKNYRGFNTSHCPTLHVDLPLDLPVSRLQASRALI